MSSPVPPLQRLRDGVRRVGVPLCLGIDPRVDELPAGLPPDPSGVERFAHGLLEAVAAEVVAVKFNTAYFEAMGSAGWAVLERVRADVPPELVVIIDAKRGDIGRSAARYADALLGRLSGDAVTLQPYLGADAVEPFLAVPDRLVYLVARTSNPSAGTFQDLAVGDGRLDEAVAEWAATRWTDGRVGLVVGATVPADLARLRARVPGPGFLVPGVGAQGADLGPALAACHGTWAPGLVTISRGIAAASRGTDWAEQAARAARSWADRMRGPGATLGASS